jgi:hypothetical protein
MNTERNSQRVITVIQPSVSLTHVYVANLLPNKDGLIAPKAYYDPIVALLYRSNSHWEGANPDVMYSSDYVTFVTVGGNHTPEDDGPCGCSRRGFQRCGEFGILPGIPDELRDDQDLSTAIGRRVVHLIEVNALDAEKKNKQREYSRLYNQRKKAEKLAREAAAAEEGIVPEEEAETEKKRAAQEIAHIYTNIELHPTCGQPLPRSLEELAHFQQSIAEYPDQPPYWCTCA